MLIKHLKEAGAVVTWHDPIVNHFEGEQSSPMSSIIDLGLIVTPHDIMDFSNWRLGEIPVFDLSPNTKNFGWPKYF